MWNNVVNAWWPLLFYRATDAPRFRRGAIAMICVAAATLGVTWLVWFLERREDRTLDRGMRSTAAVDGSRASVEGDEEDDGEDGARAPGKRSLEKSSLEKVDEKV